jgi:hypothetical protein
MAVLSQTIYTEGYSQVSGFGLMDVMNINPPFIIYNEIGNHFTPYNADWWFQSIEFYLGKWILGASSIQIVCKLYQCVSQIPFVELATSTTEKTPSQLSGSGTQFAQGAWETFVFQPIRLSKDVTYAVTLQCDTSWLDATKDRAYWWAFSANTTNFSPSYGTGAVNFNTYLNGWTAALNGYHYRLNGVPLGVSQPDPLPGFPSSRPTDYDPDQIWTPSEESYTEPEWQDPGFSNYQAAGGGRWGQQLVAVGKGLVYYEQRE